MQQRLAEGQLGRVDVGELDVDREQSDRGRRLIEDDVRLAIEAEQRAIVEVALARTEWRFAKNARYGAADAVQFLGPGDDTISLSGSVYSDGETSIDQLREMADQSEPWPLVSAAGRHFGSYIIERVDERHTAFWPDGSPRAIDFVIDLSRFPDQDQASAS